MPDLTPSAAHVAAAHDLVRAYAYPDPLHVAEILAEHFPSPPPVQEFAALAAAIPESYGPWTLDEEHPAVVHGLNDDDTGIAFDSEELARYLVAVQPAAISAMIAALGRERARADELHGLIGKAMALRAADATAGEQTPAPPSPAAPADPGSAPTAR